MKNDVPEEWRIRAKAGLCPVCGKSPPEFDKGQRIYCSQKCRDLYASKYTFWSNLRNKVLEREGERCNVCGITKDLWRRDIEIRQNEEKEKWIERNRDYINALRDRALVELDEEYRERFEQIMDDKHFLDTRFFPWEKKREIRMVDELIPRFEVDHKIALCNGGDMWDENNLWVVCNKCHKKKTKIDLKEMLLGDNQTKLNRIFEV